MSDFYVSDSLYPPGPSRVALIDLQTAQIRPITGDDENIQVVGWMVMPER